MVERSHGDGLDGRLRDLSEQVEEMRAALSALQETVAAMQSRAGRPAPSDGRGRRDDEVVRSVSEAIGRATNRRQRTRGNVS